MILSSSQGMLTISRTKKNLLLHQKMRWYHVPFSSYLSHTSANKAVPYDTRTISRIVFSSTICTYHHQFQTSPISLEMRTMTTYILVDNLRDGSILQLQLLACELHPIPLPSAYFVITHHEGLRRSSRHRKHRCCLFTSNKQLSMYVANLNQIFPRKIDAGVILSFL